MRVGVGVGVGGGVRVRARVRVGGRVGSSPLSPSSEPPPCVPDLPGRVSSWARVRVMVRVRGRG